MCACIRSQLCAVLSVCNFVLSLKANPVKDCPFVRVCVWLCACIPLVDCPEVAAIVSFFLTSLHLAPLLRPSPIHKYQCRHAFKGLPENAPECDCIKMDLQGGRGIDNIKSHRTYDITDSATVWLVIERPGDTCTCTGKEGQTLTNVGGIAAYRGSCS